MASTESQQHYPSPAPPFPSADGHETRDCYPAQDTSRPLPSQQDSYLTPYLGLRARLSQTWINRWTILLLLVLIRLVFALASIDDNLATARKQALSACTSVEDVGSAMASMPHYMSQGVNELTARGVEKAIDGLMEMLMLTISGVEEIVVFVINLLTSTYLCLITFAVGGSLHVAISVAEDVGNALNSTIQDVGKDLSSAASTFQDEMNGFMSELNKLGNLLPGSDSSPPTIDLAGEIQKLSDLQLPTGYDQDLERLNASIPTFEQVKNLTDTAIRFPFEEVKKLLNESLPTYTMNRSLFPVPAKEQLTFCSDNDGVNDFFDGLVKVEHVAQQVFFAVLITLACLAMLPMGYVEFRRWRTMRNRVRVVETDGAYDQYDAVYIISRVHTAGFGLWLSKKFFSSTRPRLIVRWTVAYATTIPALFVLSLALAGLLGCLLQYILLRALEKEAPVLEQQVIDFADKVIYQLNNASEQWAVGTNAVILQTNEKINQDVFGWVNTTTGAVNNTLNVFVDEMTKDLNTTFGGTVLYDPIMEVLNCLVLLKIKGIQKGLTWVSDHAHVDFPILPNDTFSLGTIQKVSGSGSPADILSTSTGSAATDAMNDAIDHVFKFLNASLRQEAILSTCVLLIWFLIVLIGLGRALLFLAKPYQGNVRPWNSQWLPGNRSSSCHEKIELQPTNPVRIDYKGNDRWSPASSRPSSCHEKPELPLTNVVQTGNKYNGQAYTLTPRPLPTFNDANTSSNLDPPVEKLGFVTGSNVNAAIRQQTLRISSHGDCSVASPKSPPYPDPFISKMTDNKNLQNPFADPER